MPSAACTNARPALRALHKGSLRWAPSVTMLLAVWIALCLGGSAAPTRADVELEFISSESARDVAGHAGLYARLELRVAGRAVRVATTLTEVFDAVIDEATPDTRQSEGLTLAARKRPAGVGRSAVLLAFDVEPLMTAEAFAPVDVESVDLRIFRTPLREVEGVDRSRLGGLIRLYGVPASSPWTANALPDLARSWREGVALGLQPAADRPFYPDTLQLATLDRSEGAAVVGDALARDLRFFGRALTNYVVASLVPGGPRFVRFILYPEESLPESPGLDDGPIPSSNGVDYGHTGLARSDLRPPLAPTGSGLPLAESPLGPTVVRSDDVIIQSMAGAPGPSGAPTRLLVAHDPFLSEVARAEISALCFICDAADASQLFVVEALHLQSDGRLIVSYAVSNAATGGRFQFRAMRLSFGLSVLTDVQVHQSDHTTFIAPNSFESTLSPAGTLWVRARNLFTFQVEFIYEVNLQGVGEVFERPLPVVYTPADSGRYEDVLFDPAGNQYLLWSEGDFGPGGFRVFVQSRDALGNVRYDVTLVDERLAASAISEDAIVDRDGTLWLVTEGTQQTTYTLHSIRFVPGVGTERKALGIPRSAAMQGLAFTDGLGRVVFAAPFVVDPTGEAILWDFTSQTGTLPMVAGPGLGRSAYALATPGAFIAVQSDERIVYVDPTGMPLFRGPFEGEVRAAFPSRSGLYYLRNTVAGESGSIVLEHQRAGGPLLFTDDEPRDQTVRTDPSGACDPMLRELIGGRINLGIVNVPEGVPPGFAKSWTVEQAGPGDQGGWIRECSDSEPPICFEYFCPGPDRGVAALYPAPIVESGNPSALRHWTTVRRFVVEPLAASGFRLEVTPATTTIPIDGTATIEALDDGGALSVEWRVLAGGELLDVDPSGFGPAILIDPRDDAPVGTIVLEAVDPVGARRRGISIALSRPPRLVGLIPDPNPDVGNDPDVPVSPIRKGGDLWRYYRITDGPLASPDETGIGYPEVEAVFEITRPEDPGAAPVTIRARGVTAALASHQSLLRDVDLARPGLLAVHVPWQKLVDPSDPTMDLPEGTIRDVELVGFAGATGATVMPTAFPHRFQVRVENRPYRKQIDLGADVSASFVGKITLGGRAGFGFEDRDLRDGALDRRFVELVSRAGLGVTILNQLAFTSSTKEITSVDAIDGGIQVGFTSEIGFGALGRFVFDASQPPGSPQEQLALLMALEAAQIDLEELVLGDGTETIATESLPLAGLVRSAVEELGTSAYDLLLDHTEEYSIGLSVAAGGTGTVGYNLNLGSENLRRQVPLTLLMSGGIYRARLTAGVHAAPDQVGAIVERRARLELEGFSESIMPPSSIGIEFCGLSTCTLTGFFIELSVDQATGALAATRLGVVTMEGGPKTWEATGPDAQILFGENCERGYAALALATLCANCGTCPIESIGDRLTALRIILSPSSAVSAVTEMLERLPISSDLAWQRDRTATLTAGLGLGGKILGVGVSAAGSLAVAQTQQPIVAGVYAGSGVSVGGSGRQVTPTEFPLEQYDAVDDFMPPLTAAIEPELNFQLTTTAALETLTDLVTQRTQHSFPNGVPDSFVHPPAAGAQAVIARAPDPASPIELSATWDGTTDVAFASWRRGAATDPRKRRDVGGDSPTTVIAVIGDLHDFHQEPDDGSASFVGTVSLGYPLAELNGLDESALTVGRWDETEGIWESLPSAVDLVSHRVSAATDREGVHAVLYRATLACPVVSLDSSTPGQLELDWLANAEPEVNGYAIYRARESDPVFERIATVDAAQTSFVDSEPPEGGALVRYAVSATFGPGYEGCLSAATSDDADGDGISDRFERDHGLVLGVDDGPGDPDGDGLVTADELRLGTLPEVADSDGDGLGDGDEVMLYGSDPLRIDSDGDGLDDATELVLGTDVLLRDSDGDGLDDGSEVSIHGSDPLAVDSDGDGLDDGREVNALGTNPAVPDSDGDGLDDAAELLLGTDPTDFDSDDDGIYDGAELAQGSNPLDGGSLPDVRAVPVGSPWLVLLVALMVTALAQLARGGAHESVLPGRDS